MEIIYSRKVENLLNKWKKLREYFFKVSDYKTVDYCNENILKILRIAIPKIFIKKEIKN